MAAAKGGPQHGWSRFGAKSHRGPVLRLDPNRVATGCWLWHLQTAPKFHVVAYDFGVKKNILRMLAERGCKVTVVPAKTPAAEVLKHKPDGIFCPTALATHSLVTTRSRQLPS